MNRQERRKAGIKKTEPIINIKVSEIDRIKEEAVAKGCERALFLLLAIPVMIIHDKFGELMKKDAKHVLQTWLQNYMIPMKKVMFL